MEARDAANLSWDYEPPSQTAGEGEEAPTEHGAWN